MKCRQVQLVKHRIQTGKPPQTHTHTHQAACVLGIATEADRDRAAGGQFAGRWARGGKLQSIGVSSSARKEKKGPVDILY